jgi:hypothetical protein
MKGIQIFLTLLLRWPYQHELLLVRYFGEKLGRSKTYRSRPNLIQSQISININTNQNKAKHVATCNQHLMQANQETFPLLNGMARPPDGTSPEFDSQWERIFRA